MIDVYKLSRGKFPILVSMPHNGSLIPESISNKMTESAKMSKDTDWFLDKLYNFCTEMELSIIEPIFSRYVIDLNRSEDDENLYPGADTTGLCPTSQFDKTPIYLPGNEPTAEDIEARVEQFWRPYHNALKAELVRLKERHGRVLLFEAHSIKSEVPRFFDGVLPDFNFGDNSGKSTSHNLHKRINDWQPEAYSKVFNQRFKGGYITREYGVPDDNMESLQLELSQATYMNEDELSYNDERAKQVQVELRALFNNLKEYVASKF
ncbi:N-formylglutamate deformylase [Aliikangiella sp. G2MR2-5]|uniref:N-formylglutamate deformylase n=1 Tax=Aliikangiella sp. G2MR2-5 TaxID=2788943 RepID=UPI0018ABB157|nr:N-formylglutamate deformylase [Aliikangiella sp. G2MR2-5]